MTPLGPERMFSRLPQPILAREAVDAGELRVIVSDDGAAAGLQL
jgi:hypothetical protein